MATYSFSQIQLFNQCNLRYRFKYIDKLQIEQEEETADLILGQIVHSVLEKLYKDINDFKEPVLQNYIDYYYSLREEKKNELQEKDQEIAIKSDSSLEDFINRGYYYITSYYNKNYPFENIKVISTEQFINFELDENIKFRWIIDRLDKVDDIFVINDYKTNKNLPTQDKQDYIDQITLYGFGIKQKYWKYLNKIKWSLHFLHFDIEDTREITDDLMDRVVNYYKDIIKDMESKKFAYNMWNKDAFVPTENQGCRFCEFRSICPLFAHASMDDEVISWMWETTIKNLVDEFGKLNEEITKLNKQKENLKNIISWYARENNLKRLYWYNYKVSYYQGSTYKILDNDKTKELLEAKWKLQEVTDISTSKLWKFFKNWNLKLGDFEEVIQENKFDVLRSYSNN